MLTSINMNNASGTVPGKQFLTKKSQGTGLCLPPAPVKEATDAVPVDKFIVPKNFDTSTFLQRVEMARRGGSRKLAYFNVVSQNTQQQLTLCVTHDGVLGLKSRDAFDILFMHHFTLIRSFLAPPPNSSSSQVLEPVGYVLAMSTVSDEAEDMRLLYKFDNIQERHLFLNVVTRFANEMVDKEMRKLQSAWRDHKSSPGIHADSPKAVADHIRQRRTRAMSDMDARKQLKFEKQEELIQQAIRLRTGSVGEL